MDLNSGFFKPFMKPNDTPLYVHKQSNHPKNILANIPLSVNRRLSCISSNEAIFNEAIPPYQEALNKSGYQHQLKFDPPGNKNTKKNRSRKVTWFNPPFSANVKTNVGRNFLKLIDSSFPPENPLHKLFNRNTVKMSYKCMPNIKQAISRHNTRLLNNQQQEQPEPGCNCQAGIGSCPVAGQCKKTNVVYRAAVTTDNGNTEYYTGLTGNMFKERYSGHKTSFKHEKYMHKTTLSTHIWKLKSENKNFTTRWSLLDRATHFNPTTRDSVLQKSGT